MDCDDVRLLLLDLSRGRLDAVAQAPVRSHLGGCPDCRRAAEVEAALDDALATLPRPEAPLALRRRLAGQAALALRGEAVERPAGTRPGPRRWPSRVIAPALAAALALLSVGLAWELRVERDAAAAGRITDEVVSDHLRLLTSLHPLDLESAENHQVKPWFEGRLDFAPVVPTPEVHDLALRGGSVGYVLDRKAAVISYALRRHAVTLLAFRVDGLAWPAARAAVGQVPAWQGGARGFNVVLWRAGELGYALVSDVSAADLDAVAASLAPATRH